MDTVDSFNIREVGADKKQYMPLLLIGDESELMIGRYIDKVNLYVGFLNEEPIALCAVEPVGADVLEIRNLAVLSDHRRHGYGRRMLEFAESLHPGATFVLGTGETPSTLRFYKSCGYSYSHRVPGFFTENYPDPIIEEGIVLCDMIYLKK